MPTLKAKTNRLLKRWPFPSRIAEYALESGMSSWSILIGINMLGGNPPSSSLQDLPAYIGYTWAALMMLAGATMICGVFIKPRNHTISRGMYLMGSALLAYSAAVAGTAGWLKGGAIATFLLVIGVVCLLRGWWLKDREVMLEKELAREREGK